MIYLLFLEFKKTLLNILQRNVPVFITTTVNVYSKIYKLCMAVIGHRLTADYDMIK